MSFKPLLALLIAFRECEVFFFGTAKTHGGRSSRRVCNDGGAKAKGFDAAQALGSKVAAKKPRARGVLIGDRAPRTCESAREAMV